MWRLALLATLLTACKPTVEVPPEYPPLEAPTASTAADEAPALESPDAAVPPPALQAPDAGTAAAPKAPDAG